MKKLLCLFWGILTITSLIAVSSVMVHRTFRGKDGLATASCVSERTAVKMARAAGLNVTGTGELNAEDIRMQIVYQLARRSIVKVIVKDSAGSGTIWKIEDGIVIVSNKHLLKKDVQAEIVFGNGTTATADVIGYSGQYDIGFVRIQEGAVADSVLRDIYEAVPLLYEAGSEEEKAAFEAGYLRKQVLQVGAVMDQNAVNISTGNVVGLAFVPLFNTNVLVTECFSRAGMSGGGVFDEGGRFLGMISGGEVPEDAEVREAEITYSIPPSLIEAEYEMIIG
ncbi:MAG: serine protease [Lachnospiraceae bacterium]